MEVQIDRDLNFGPFKYSASGLNMGAYTISAICCTSRQKTDKRYGAKKFKYFMCVLSYRDVQMVLESL